MVDRHFHTEVADKQCGGLQTRVDVGAILRCAPCEEASRGRSRSRGMAFTLRANFLDRRESQCSDRFHKPVLVGATPTPASHFKVRYALRSNHSNPSWITSNPAAMPTVATVTISSPRDCASHPQALGKTAAPSMAALT
jgi:hypothetical protein